MNGFRLWSKGNTPTREVRGLEFRKAEVRRLMPPRITGRVQIQVEAALVHEPGNRHDPNAVAVVVAGTHIGYLPREEAPNYLGVLDHLARQGLVATVLCTISGNEWETTTLDRRGREIPSKEFYAYAFVVLDEWHRCLPLNPPPAARYALLPVGSALQVQKEEEHQSALRRFVNEHGESWAYATLHVVGGSASAKPLVEVRLDDNRVGQLTPAMSTHFVPTIQLLAGQGTTTAARVIVKGNAIKAEVILHAAKSHELDADWVLHNASLPPMMAESSPSPPPSERAVASAGTGRRFNPAPGWPSPPPGWQPPQGWEPPKDWPPAPKDWRFWVPE